MSEPFHSPRRTRVKICGITTVDAARAAVRAGADAVGCVFAAGSPRQIDIDTAAEIVAMLPPFVTPVGVFQLAGANDQTVEEWMRMSPWVQLHGEEDEATVKRLSRRARIVRGFRFERASINRWNACPHLSMMLIEGDTPGSGRPFDYTKLARLAPTFNHPLALAGGLRPDNVGDAVDAVRPYAVDVSSGVESAPGVKDAALINAFCASVKEADARADRRNES